MAEGGGFMLTFLRTMMGSFKANAQVSNISENGKINNYDNSLRADSGTCQSMTLGKTSKIGVMNCATDPMVGPWRVKSDVIWFLVRSLLFKSLHANISYHKRIIWDACLYYSSSSEGNKKSKLGTWRRWWKRNSILSFLEENEEGKTEEFQSASHHD